jgi:hypothetical protein
MGRVSASALVLGSLVAFAARADPQVPASLQGWFAYRYGEKTFGKCSAIDAREAARLKASYQCERGGRVNGTPGTAVRCTKGNRGVVALEKLVDCQFDREEENANGD